MVVTTSKLLIFFLNYMVEWAVHCKPSGIRRHSIVCTVHSESRCALSKDVGSDVLKH
jgi:hypothetical protein